MLTIEVKGVKPVAVVMGLYERPEEAKANAALICAARGHEAWSCDFLPSETEGNHLTGDVLQWLKGSPRGHKWDLLITHPPCKFLSASGMHWTTRGLRDPKLTVAAIRFAEALWNAPVKRTRTNQR